jgi:hypothetical protein
MFGNFGLTRSPGYVQLIIAKVELQGRKPTFQMPRLMPSRAS